ncbi:MAG: anaerobic ribonucleoside-triphosphate reductase activating protein [Eubacterium sp.]|nr:anaerobic ribonucleoside-triphosphate reductase activating protein [Eubacterium sp.]
MKIHGLQKLTLLDFPSHTACTVFLGTCDFRCPYCHNYELVDGSAPAIMEADEVFAFLRKRQGLLDGVAVTGGEPCMNRELPAFLSEVRELGFATKVDTNGNHPAMLRRILSEGLADYVAMDVKNSPDKYAMTIGLPSFNLKRVQESIDLLLSSGIDYEFRTTCVREFHEERDFREIGEMIRGAKRYFLQNFTDRESVPYGNLHGFSREEMEIFSKIMAESVETVEIRGID